MLIVDAQVHLWGKGTTLPPHRTEPYLADEAIRDMDAAGVSAALLHPPSWDPDSNELSVAAVEKYPGRFAILGRFALDRPESRALIDGWKKRPGMLGLRFTFLQAHQRRGPPTARPTGCGPRRRRQDCRWRSWPPSSCR